VTPQHLELQRCSSLEDALDRGGMWSDWPSGVAAPAPPVFWGEDIEARLLMPHRERAPYPAMGVCCVKRAIVRDEAFVADASGQLYVSDKIYPAYINKWLEKGELPKENRSLEDLERVELPGTSALVHNSHADVYGHWLVEGLPKLLFLGTLGHRPARLIMHSTAQPHVSKWLKLVAPDVPIETYNPATQYVVCERLMIPTMACSPHYVFNPALLSLLKRLAPPGGGERLLYLDRPWRGFTHWMENPDEVQDLAQSLGFEVFSPFRRTLEEQIDAFSNAKVIAGDYGSSLHNSLLSAAHTRVLCFNWVTFMQSRIAQLCGQRIGFQMGDTGAPLLKRGYRVDLDEAKRAFEAALSAGE
jgi:capsular polysaccharide biosynthesis protein